MNIAAAVRASVRRRKPGKIFSCQDLPCYRESPGGVSRELGRLVARNELERLDRGRYYVPEMGLLGRTLAPLESEIMRYVLYRKGRLIGYVTGLALYNQLHLSTQVPIGTTVAINGKRKSRRLGYLRVEFVPSQAPVRKADVLLLQYLDALRDIERIPATGADFAARVMTGWLRELDAKQVRRIQRLALNYYKPVTRALLGMLLERSGHKPDPALRASLNPSASYRIHRIYHDDRRWPNAKEWFIW